MDWLDGYYDNLFLRLVRQNLATKALEVNGTAIDPYEFTWTQFELLTSSDYAKIHVRVTDRHQDSGGVGGVLFVGGASWTLLDPYIYYATLAAAPSPTNTKWPKLRVYANNVGVGGSVLIANGTRYRLQEPSILLENTLTDTSHAGPFSTELFVKSIPLPVDVNSKSIFDDRDVIQVQSAWCNKTGTVNDMTRRYLIGSSTSPAAYTNAATGEIITSVITGVSGALGRWDRLMEIIRLSNTTVQCIGIATGTFTSGAQSTTYNTIVTTTTAIDSATPPSLHYGLKLNLDTTDTALKLIGGYRVALIRGY